MCRLFRKRLVFKQLKKAVHLYICSGWLTDLAESLSNHLGEVQSGTTESETGALICKFYRSFPITPESEGTPWGWGVKLEQKHFRKYIENY